MTVWEKLREPFPFNEIEIKVQSVSKDKTKALPVAYFDARIVRRRLDEVFGPENWTAKHRELFEGPKIVGVVCELTVFHDGKEVRREEVGVPSAIEPIKGAYSDAIKRAFAAFGNDHLYHIDLGWHPCQDNKFQPFNTATIKAIETRYKAQIEARKNRTVPEVSMEDEYNDETPAGTATRGVDAVKNRLGIKEAQATEWLVSIGLTMPDIGDFQAFVNGNGDWAELALRGKATGIKNKEELYSKVEKAIRL